MIVQLVIKASPGRRIDALLADLGAPEAVTRETAVARLTILGSRAVERLIGLLDPPAPPATRTAALDTLATIGDPHALKPALLATSDPDEDVAVAAVATSRVFLRTARGAEVVDRLTAIALDRARTDAIRSAAIRVLMDLEPPTVAPLVAALGDDPSEAVRAAASVKKRAKPRDALEELEEAAVDPGALRRLLPSVAARAPLAALLCVVERARGREEVEAGARAEWMAARGAAHMALARRGSRLALYDLRETFASARTPLPADFVAAVLAVGDESCLEPLAAAYARAGAGGNTRGSRDRQAWWRQQLADAFHAIVKQKRVTRRHAALRKIERGLVNELWPRRSGASGGSGPVR